jgi:hypothetical protein
MDPGFKIKLNKKTGKFVFNSENYSAINHLNDSFWIGDLMEPTINMKLLPPPSLLI